MIDSHADDVKGDSFFIDGEKSSLVMGIGKGYPLVERFLIGTMWDSSGEFFSGTIDDIVIWDRKLSEDEIKSLYNSGLGIDPTIDTLNYKSSENLIAFWPFSEGLDSSITDFSGNGFDGQISGASWVNIESKLNPVVEILEVEEEQDVYQKELWGKITDKNGKSLYQANILLIGFHNEE